jgi:hypothetical protein
MGWRLGGMRESRRDDEMELYRAASRLSAAAL